MNRLIPSSTRWAIEIETQTSDFLLYYNEAAGKPVKDYKLIVEGLHLNICYVVLNNPPSRIETIRIAFTNYDLVTYTAKAGSFTTGSGSMQLKTFPSRVMIFFVRTDAYNGTQKQNPFCFDNPRLNEFTVTIDDKEYRFEPGDKEDMAIDAYYQLIRDCYMPRHGEEGYYPISRQMLNDGK
jgi:hypothetical protein